MMKIRMVKLSRYLICWDLLHDTNMMENNLILFSKFEFDHIYLINIYSLKNLQINNLRS
jgi:hypothetical protein